jgi:hypothetical protein
MSDAALPRVGDLRVERIAGFRDRRGVLFPAELLPLCGFAPQRLFWVADVPSGTVRGGHSHLVCSQYLICVAGRVSVTAFDGSEEARLPLAAGEAVMLRPGLFATQTFEAPGSLLLVLCDRPYEPADYLRSRDEFAAWRAAAEAGR